MSMFPQKGAFGVEQAPHREYTPHQKAVFHSTKGHEMAFHQNEDIADAVAHSAAQHAGGSRVTQRASDMHTAGVGHFQHHINSVPVPQGMTPAPEAIQHQGESGGNLHLTQAGGKTPVGFNKVKGRGFGRSIGGKY